MSDDSALKSPFDDDDQSPSVFSAFKPPQPKKTSSPPVRAMQEDLKRVVDDVAEKRGFTKRAKPKKRRMRRSRYYETGRSEQIAIKGRAEDKERLRDICEAHDWVQGQALQYALDALIDKLDEPDSPFWQDRHINGVD